MLTSARSADFWLRLCSARHLEGAEDLVAAFVKAEAAGKAALQQHTYDYAKEQIGQVKQLAGPVACTTDCSHGHYTVLGSWRHPRHVLGDIGRMKAQVATSCRLLRADRRCHSVSILS